MQCPVCGSSNLDFQADRFICLSCGEVYPPSKMLEFLDSIGDWMRGGPLGGSSSGAGDAGAGGAGSREPGGLGKTVVSRDGDKSGEARDGDKSGVGTGTDRESPYIDLANLTADLNSMNSASELGALAWQMIGECMTPSIERIRRYGARYDELDAEKGGRMREYLGRSVSEQFDRDLVTVACRFALSDDRVAPEELALINSAFGLNLDEAALRERARSASVTSAGKAGGVW